MPVYIRKACVEMFKKKEITNYILKQSNTNEELTCRKIVKTKSICPLLFCDG